LLFHDGTSFEFAFSSDISPLGFVSTTRPCLLLDFAAFSVELQDFFSFFSVVFCRREVVEGWVLNLEFSSPSPRPSSQGEGEAVGCPWLFVERRASSSGECSGDRDPAERDAPLIQNSTFLAGKANVSAMRINIKPAYVVAVLGAAVLCLSGCGKKNENGSQENTSSESSTENAAADYPLPDPPVVVNCAPGIRGGHLIISELGEPKTFNYITANEQSSIDICRFMFWSLLNMDEPTQEVKPGLADFWTNSPDGKTWTFRLRKNLRWSDGAPLTADDVVFTWNEVIYNPKIDNVTRDGFIIGGKEFKITKVDDLTIQVETPVVYAPFLADFGSGVPIVPKHILEPFVTNGTFTSAYSVNTKPEDIVGSGPYRLKEYKPAQYTILERNPYFLEVDTNGTRLPYLDDIIFTVVPDFDTEALRLLSGEADADDMVRPMDYDRFKAAADAGKIALLDPGIGLDMISLCFNENTNVDAKTGKPLVDPAKLKWFRDTRFRQAVSYGINRDEMIQAAYSGRAVPIYASDTPGDKKWFDPNIKTYPYDPAKALALLQEMGIEKRNGDAFLTDSNGNKIEFVLNANTGSSVAEKCCIFVQDDLKKLGIHVIYQPIEFNSLMDKLYSTYDFECAFSALGSGSVVDPSGNMNVLKSDGFTHDWFPQQKTPSTPWEARIDQLMDDQLSTLDFDQRKKDFDEVQEIMAEQQPLIFTVTPHYYAAIKPNISNVRPTALGGYRATWNVEELYYEK
jgi:peptide/nickel transport system substrate-binding protein